MKDYAIEVLEEKLKEVKEFTPVSQPSDERQYERIAQLEKAIYDLKLIQNIESGNDGEKINFLLVNAIRILNFDQRKVLIKELQERTKIHL